MTSPRVLIFEMRDGILKFWGRMYVPKVWEEHLSLVEFAYNNSYHDNVRMAPYEVYGGRALSMVDVLKLLTVGHSNKQSLWLNQVGGAIHTQARNVKTAGGEEASASECIGFLGGGAISLRANGGNARCMGASCQLLRYGYRSYLLAQYRKLN